MATSLRSSNESCSGVVNAGRNLVLWLLRGYKWAISPALPPACRYVPTCSEYAMEAIERWGVIRGGTKALWRLLCCHPLAKGGLDPVTETKCGSTAYHEQVF